MGTPSTILFVSLPPGPDGFSISSPTDLQDSSSSRPFNEWQAVTHALQPEHLSISTSKANCSPSSSLDEGISSRYWLIVLGWVPASWIRAKRSTGVRSLCSAKSWSIGERSAAAGRSAGPGDPVGKRSLRVDIVDRTGTKEVEAGRTPWTGFRRFNLVHRVHWSDESGSFWKDRPDCQWNGLWDLSGAGFHRAGMAAFELGNSIDRLSWPQSSAGGWKTGWSIRASNFAPPSSASFPKRRRAAGQKPGRPQSLTNQPKN